MAFNDASIVCLYIKLIEKSKELGLFIECIQDNFIVWDSEDRNIREIILKSVDISNVKAFLKGFQIVKDIISEREKTPLPIKDKQQMERDIKAAVSKYLSETGSLIDDIKIICPEPEDTVICSKPTHTLSRKKLLLYISKEEVSGAVRAFREKVKILFKDNEF